MAARVACDHCGRAGVPLRRCARCLGARYCGQTCQRAHYSAHKPVCVPPDLKMLCAGCGHHFGVVGTMPRRCKRCKDPVYCSERCAAADAQHTCVVKTSSDPGVPLSRSLTHREFELNAGGMPGLFDGTTEITVVNVARDIVARVRERRPLMVWAELVARAGRLFNPVGGRVFLTIDANTAVFSDTLPVFAAQLQSAVCGHMHLGDVCVLYRTATTCYSASYPIAALAHEIMQA